MKKVSKVLAIVLCLALILSITALADWTEYQGNDNHNGVIDTAPYITDLNGGTPGTTHMGKIRLGSGGWSGIDTEALMLTEGTKTYAYVTYNGGTANNNLGGTRLAKIDVTAKDNNNNLTPSEVWSVQLTKTAGFQLSTPVYYNEKIYVAGTGLSQLLPNDELALSYDENNDVYYYENWTAPSSGQFDGYVRLTGNSSATFTSSEVDITSGYTHRPAVGIKLGTTSPSSTKAEIKVYYISGGTPTELATYNFSPNATNSSFRPIKNNEDQNYYYYLNENLTSAQNAYLSGSSYQFRYVITITDSDTNPGYVDVEYCSFYEQNSTIFEVSNLTSSTPSSSAITTIGTNGGQINTPITGYDYVEQLSNNTTKTHKCIYFGTYSGTHSYFQYDLTDDVLTPFQPTATTGGFYWAGAYSDGTYVAFGGDNGYLYCTPAADFGGTGTKQYSLNTLASISDAGNVRSTLCYYDATNDNTDNGYLYFTSQGGTGTSYLWRVYWPSITNLTASGVSRIALPGGSSTSTPVISSNGYIYVGTYGASSYSNNGVRAYPLSTFDADDVIVIAQGSGSGNSADKCVVQSSVIVYTSGNTDYVFFTLNQAGGSGYCYSHTISGNNHTVDELWNTESDPNGNFTLQGMSACNGYLVFGNDGHYFYVIK